MVNTMAAALEATPSPVRTRSNSALSTNLMEDEKPQNSNGTLNDTNNPLPDIEKGQNSDATAPAKDENHLVVFDGPEDPDNPKNWTAKRRWAITISMGLMVFTVTFASSIFSVNIRVVQEKFHVDLVTATLGVALFVLGFVFGPIAFGPMSEVLGRKIPLFFGFALFAVFQIPVALAQNITTICVGRFLGGFFASAPLAVVGLLISGTRYLDLTQSVCLQLVVSPARWQGLLQVDSSQNRSWVGDGHRGSRSLWLDSLALLGCS
jgi:DHA1 family multidrug resistance protein-like MFS transporter